VKFVTFHRVGERGERGEGAPVLLSFAFACLTAACVSPPPAPAFVPRRRSLTVMAPNDGVKAFNSSFGVGNWKALGPYIDLLLTKRSAAVPATMLTAVYTDVDMCSNLTGPGHNDYPAPDCTAWPADAFYTQPGHPERALSSKYGGFLQRSGDPSSPTMRALSLALFKSALADGHEDLVYLDDANPPEEGYGAFCWGVPSMLAGSGECEGAPGGTAHGPYGAGPAGWVKGMRALIGASPKPVVLNGLAGYAGHGPSVVAGLVASEHNAWGAACDGCFYGYSNTPTNRFLWSGALFLARLDGALHITGAGKNVIVVNASVTDPAMRERALSDIMLYYDPDHSWFWDAACGERSHIRVCPEAALTFYRPVRPYPKDSGDLQAPGGTLVREFEACYAEGRPAGPCAAVVNPDAYASMPRPTLHHAYAHTLTITGSSLCVCYGDSGSVAFGGPPAPATLPPASGYVLFR
jgi:hypothetical protein